MSVDFAFLDSGIGGIPYLLFLQEKQQNVNCIYYADTKNFPYGQKSSEQIIENATIATQKIIEKWMALDDVKEKAKKQENSAF